MRIASVSRRRVGHAVLVLLPLVVAACAPRRAAVPAADVAASGVAAPRSDPAACEAVRGYLDSVRVAGPAPGMVLGVAFPDGRSCALAVGLADTARREAMRPEALLMSGSIGKTYVAAVALQLVGEGRLALDAPISRYIGGEPWFDRLPNARQITVRQLMRHTSGLVRYELDPRFLADLTAAPQKSWTPAERIAYLLDRPAPFAAGAGWDYSDTNYIVLGLILERITGRPLNDEIARRVLRPLALRATRPTDSPVIPGLAQGYAGPRNEFGGFDAMVRDGRFVINPQFEWAGGGYASSAEDLARWTRDYFEGRAYPDSLVRVATDGVEARMLGQGARYGLGVIIRPSPLGETWGHSGFFPGYVAEARYWPSRRMAVTLQVNTSVAGALGRPPGQVLNEVARRLGAATPAPPPTPDRGAALSAADSAALVTAFRDEMAALRAPGAAMAVVVGDRIVLERGAGTTSVEGGVAVTPETLFRLGSTTKMFTGRAALMLAGENRLRLDQPIGGYARGLSPAIGRLTLHQLLTHTAGLVNAAAGDGPHDDAALGARVRGWGGEMSFAAPDAIYSYSSPGYWLAGFAIEQAAGGWYADRVDSLILAPVGMRRSTFRPLRAFTHPVALDHRVGPEGAAVVRPFPDDATTWASGSLFSSAHELGRFLVALLDDGRLDGRQVLPAAAVRALAEPHVAVPGTPCRYAYGLQVCDAGGVRVLSHAGFRGGSGSAISFVPGRRVGVVLLSNRNGGIMRRTEQRALELLARLPADAPPVAGAARAFDAAARARLAGVYANGPDTLHLLDRGGALTYRYGRDESRTRPGDTDGELLVLDPTGEPVQRFVTVPDRGAVRYLHDGLSAFRRLGR